jgi:hypothetical protein
MKFYYVDSGGVTEFCEEPRYFKTLAAAKQEARRVAMEADRDIEVEHVEIGNSYAEVLDLLNYHSRNEKRLGVVSTARNKESFK